MRILAWILVGVVAIPAGSTMPVLAKEAGLQKHEEQPTLSSCHAYQQPPGGTWRASPCEEVGAGGQIQHRGVARGREEQPR